jgi:hypothetical protein
VIDTAPPHGAVTVDLQWTSWARAKPRRASRSTSALLARVTTPPPPGALGARIVRPGADAYVNFPLRVGLALRPEIAEEADGWMYEGSPCYGGFTFLGTDHGRESLLVRARFTASPPSKTAPGRWTGSVASNRVELELTSPAYPPY